MVFSLLFIYAFQQQNYLKKKKSKEKFQYMKQ